MLCEVIMILKCDISGHSQRSIQKLISKGKGYLLSIEKFRTHLGCKHE